MSEEQFTNSLREFIHRKPFLPFLVELMDGQRIIVDYPSVAFSGGAAGFLSEDDGLIDFSCDRVRYMAYITAETKL